MATKMLPAALSDSGAVVPRQKARNLPMTRMMTCMMPRWYRMAMTVLKKTTTGIICGTKEKLVKYKILLE